MRINEQQLQPISDFFKQDKFRKNCINLVSESNGLNSL